MINLIKYEINEELNSALATFKGITPELKEYAPILDATLDKSLRNYMVRLIRYAKQSNEGLYNKDESVVYLLQKNIPHAHNNSHVEHFKMLTYLGLVRTKTIAGEQYYYIPSYIHSVQDFAVKKAIRLHNNNKDKNKSSIHNWSIQEARETVLKNLVYINETNFFTSEYPELERVLSFSSLNWELLRKLHYAIGGNLEYSPHCIDDRGEFVFRLSLSHLQDKFRRTNQWDVPVIDISIALNMLSTYRLIDEYEHIPLVQKTDQGTYVTFILKPYCSGYLTYLNNRIK